MNTIIPPPATPEQVEAILRCRLAGRLRELSVLLREGRVVLRGQAVSYYTKQMAQHIVMEDLRLPILANEIEVRHKHQARHEPGQVQDA